jgi:hypothetical protein
MSHEHRPIQQHELEGLRRSLAMSDTLPKAEVLRVLDECSRLAAERVRIERILKQLGPSWRSARNALNDLSKVLHGDGER